MALNLPGRMALDLPGQMALDRSGRMALDRSGQMALDRSGRMALDRSGQMALDRSGRMALDLPGRTAPGGDGRPGQFHLHGLRWVPLRVVRGLELLGAPIGRDLVQLLARLRQRLALARAYLRQPEGHVLVARQLV